MESIKPKRFSFAGFSGLSRSLSFSKKDPIDRLESDALKDEDDRRLKRNLKTKSLYIKSFKKVSSPKTEYDPSEAIQANKEQVRSSIRRSLSAVVYASPHAKKDDKKSTSSQLVPVLVTAELSESVGGIMMDEPKSIETPKKKKKSKIVEYDNTLEVFDDEKHHSITILWQGYGYSIDKDDEDVIADLDIQEAKELEMKFENDVWDTYHGLIHPLQLFEGSKDKGRWSSLTVQELKRYYDNYGSMMLKIRQARMMKQQSLIPST